MKNFFIFCTLFSAIKSSAVNENLLTNVRNFLTDSKMTVEMIFTQKWSTKDLEEMTEMLIDTDKQLNLKNSNISDRLENLIQILQERIQEQQVNWPNF